VDRFHLILVLGGLTLDLFRSHVYASLYQIPGIIQYTKTAKLKQPVYRNRGVVVGKKIPGNNWSYLAADVVAIRCDLACNTARGLLNVSTYFITVGL